MNFEDNRTPIFGKWWNSWRSMRGYKSDHLFKELLERFIMVFSNWVELINDLHSWFFWYYLLEFFFKGTLLRWWSFFKQRLSDNLCFKFREYGKSPNLLCLVHFFNQTILKIGFLCNSTSLKNDTIFKSSIIWYLAARRYYTFLNGCIMPNGTLLSNKTVIRYICSSWNGDSIENDFIEIFSHKLQLICFGRFSFCR